MTTPTPTNEQQDARMVIDHETAWDAIEANIYLTPEAKVEVQTILDTLAHPLAAVSAAAPDERERAQRYTTVLANLNREQARAVAAEAEVAALRERIEGLHRPDDHGPGRCDKAGCITSCVECGDDWPCATIRALAADEGERTGR